LSHAKRILDNEILEYTENIDKNFSQWKKLSSSIMKVAEEVCGTSKYDKKTAVVKLEVLPVLPSRTKIFQ